MKHMVNAILQTSIKLLMYLNSNSWIKTQKLKAQKSWIYTKVETILGESPAEEKPNCSLGNTAKIEISQLTCFVMNFIILCTIFLDVFWLPKMLVLIKIQSPGSWVVRLHEGRCRFQVWAISFAPNIRH